MIPTYMMGKMNNILDIPQFVKGWLIFGQVIRTHSEDPEIGTYQSTASTNLARQ